MSTSEAVCVLSPMAGCWQLRDQGFCVNILSDAQAGVDVQWMCRTGIDVSDADCDAKLTSLWVECRAKGASK